MPVTFNSNNIGNISFDNSSIENVSYNNNVVFEKFPIIYGQSFATSMPANKVKVYSSSIQSTYIDTSQQMITDKVNNVFPDTFTIDLSELQTYLAGNGKTLEIHLQSDGTEGSIYDLNTLYPDISVPTGTNRINFHLIKGDVSVLQTREKVFDIRINSYTTNSNKDVISIQYNGWLRKRGWGFLVTFDDEEYIPLATKSCECKDEYAAGWQRKLYVGGVMVNPTRGQESGTAYIDTSGNISLENGENKRAFTFSMTLDHTLVSTWTETGVTYNKYKNTLNVVLSGIPSTYSNEVTVRSGGTANAYAIGDNEWSQLI